MYVRGAVRSGGHMTNFALDEQTDANGGSTRFHLSRIERGIRIVLLLGFALVLVFEAWMIWTLFRLN
jgi:hypothetical protein